MNSNQYDDSDVLLWGGTAIGAAIGLGQKATLRQLEAGKIKCAKKRGGRWTAWRRPLRQEFGIGSHRQQNDDDANAELRTP
jgi:hypothetical protein